MLKPRDSRKFDIVLFGATGFTGKEVAEYLALYGPQVNTSFMIICVATINQLPINLITCIICANSFYVNFINNNTFLPN